MSTPISKWYGFLGIFHRTSCQKPPTKVWPPGGRYHGTDDAPPNATTQRGGSRFSHPPKHVGRGVSESQDWIIKSSKLSKRGSLTQKRLFSRKIFWTFHIRSWDVDTFFWARWWFQIFFHPYIREDQPILTHIFQMGWFNHQLASCFFSGHVGVGSWHEKTLSRSPRQVFDKVIGLFAKQRNPIKVDGGTRTRVNILQYIYIHTWIFKGVPNGS